MQRRQQPTTALVRRVRGGREVGGSAALFAFTLHWWSSIVFVGVQAMPFQLAINQGAAECLYERLNDGEFVTVSTFILSGAQLSAKVHLEGPFAASDSVKTGQDLQAKIDKIGTNNEFKIFSETVDFEHLNLGPEEDENEQIEAKDKKEPENESNEQKRARRAAERKKMLEERQRQEERKHHQKRKVRNEGDPYTRTIKAHGEGWYRFCVTASLHPITAEMDFRKETDMGGLDAETGHVMTLAQKLMKEEDENMQLDTANEEGIDDKDFQSTKDKLKVLRRLLADIQTKQQQERHRLIVHTATNEHSHSRMVLGSLLETVLFMLVTGYQVYTIRRWFSGAPVLGR